jgi:hypothetical protein
VTLPKLLFKQVRGKSTLLLRNRELMDVTVMMSRLNTSRLTIRKTESFTLRLSFLTRTLITIATVWTNIQMKMI